MVFIHSEKKTAGFGRTKMYCLHCGWCCKNMSPLGINPCPNLVEIDHLYFCKNYEKRPEECIRHDFYTRFCPSGMIALNFHLPDDIEKVRDRIDKGDEIVTRGLNNPQSLSAEEWDDILKATFSYPKHDGRNRK